MRPQMRSRFWLETGAALAGASLALLTLVWQDWIELVFRVDPDHGNGSLEWLLVAVLLSLALTSAVLARQEWQRTPAVAPRL
jgi:hypothetical protein